MLGLNPFPSVTSFLEKACDSRSGIVRPSATMGTGERFLPALRTGAIQNPSILLHLGLQVFRDKTKRGWYARLSGTCFFRIACLSSGAVWPAGRDSGRI